MMEIVVPQVGEAAAEVTLLEWLKNEGDSVQKGEPLFEVDTDKAVVTVEGFADGTLAQILVPAGSAVVPLQVVGLLAPAGEETMVERQPVAEPGGYLKNVTGSDPGGRVVAEDGRQFVTKQSGKGPTSVGTRSPTRVNASPKARRLAKDLGLDLFGLEGTGIGGMVTVNDVQATAESIRATDPKLTSRRPLSKLRRSIATRMTASKQMVPHFYLMADVDMTQVQHLRDHCRRTPSWERPPTYTDVIVRACALALAAIDEVNVIYTDQGLIRRQTVDIGVAVSTDKGLIVPVLPQADCLSLRETSREIRGLAERARQGRLRGGDLSQKSVVVSNLGMHDVDAFIAIIDPPDPMILAVGRVADRVGAVDGQPVVRPTCTLTLSVDHRALDGTQGARFLTRVKANLENPPEFSDEESGMIEQLEIPPETLG